MAKKNWGAKWFEPQTEFFMPECGSGERMAWTLSSILSAGLHSAPLLSALTTPHSSFIVPEATGQLGQGKTVSCFSHG